ncbi:hypothetical protein KSF_001370 [Reticulibacter mediterranei]|uniref:Uncharacterized protein n=1 Tax=Reticulibacter mediterranei TaxID=2778369 RepID=A0A8J3I790_9CHLR|nr:hypothetical protein [Reticulibacter mediterranei]GHO90089.1 hypothetical protein KSF_001370 [Reticulibacter mediterranei]
MVVAAHPTNKKKSPVGVTHVGVVYELFFTNLPQQGFTASDVVELYLHRGAFEPQLADEDQEINPDPWCSHTACGQEIWCIVSQWVWNLRLELGHQLLTSPVRTTEFAPALPSPSLHTTPPSGYVPRAGWACPGKQVASQARIFLFSPMARCGVLLTRGWSPMSNVEKLMAACAWCMEPAFAVVVPVRCANSVNGMALQRQSRAK